MSVNCEFSLLKELHERLIFCGESIDPASGARYEKLVQDFSSFIAANGKGYDDQVEEVRRRLHQEGKDRICKNADYPALRRMFFHYVSDAGMAEVRVLLSRPRDPNKGDCL